LKLLKEQPENITKIVGTMYFGMTLLALDGWWLATDSDGTINQYRTEPAWCDDIEEWVVHDEQYHPVAKVDMEGTCPTKTKAQVKEYSHDPDNALSKLGHSEVVKRQALIIQAAVGRIDCSRKVPNNEYLAKIKDSEENNRWSSFFKDVLPTLAASCLSQWQWTGSPGFNQKYVNFRIRLDMRDLGCNVYDRKDNLILPELFAYQVDHENREECRQKDIDKTKPDNKELV